MKGRRKESCKIEGMGEEREEEDEMGRRKGWVGKIIVDEREKGMRKKTR